MAQDRIYSSKVPKRATPSAAANANIDPGPYEALIKNVVDTTRAGRLQVWIPELGAGDQDDPANWYTVSYASPFAGMTYQPDNLKGVKLNNFTYVQHTYGFFAVPPDIGNVVLVTFIAGDPGRGYWFACTMNKLGFGMIPAIAGGTKDKMDVESLAADLEKSLTDESIWPLSEFNENDGENVSGEFMTVKKPPHEWQARRYIKQGVDRDPERGAVTSSAQRNLPSAVFGWSSPGRKLLNDTAENETLKGKIDSGDIKEGDLFNLGRRGGHHMVMDDGDFYGKSQLMRFRTATGHQILMDDTNSNMHIINNEGTCWIELAGNGQMHIFTAQGFNVRSQGDINFHTDTNMNIHVEKKLQIYAGEQIDINTKVFNQMSTDLTKIYASTVQIGASSTMNLSSDGVGSFKAGKTLQFSGGPIHLNTSPAPVVSKPEEIPKLLHADTTFNSGNGLWEIQADKLTSIVAVAPTHEPWKREGGTSESAAVGG